MDELHRQKAFADGTKSNDLTTTVLQLSFPFHPILLTFQFHPFAFCQLRLLYCTSISFSTTNQNHICGRDELAMLVKLAHGVIASVPSFSLPSPPRLPNGPNYICIQRPPTSCFRSPDAAFLFASQNQRFPRTSLAIAEVTHDGLKFEIRLSCASNNSLPSIPHDSWSTPRLWHRKHLDRRLFSKRARLRT